MSEYERKIILDHPIEPGHINSAATRVVETLEDAGHEAYLVGGCVRDLLLGQEPKDFDVSTSATPEEVRDLFRKARLIGRRFRLVHVRFGREVIEVATFRAGGDHWETVDEADADVHEETGRILRDNVYGNVETDALRRDFTVNALYLRGSDWAVVDYCDGVADLDARVLRVIGDPLTRFREDPVRILRALRLRARLGFTLHPDTAAAIPETARLLHDIPPARLFDEYSKLFLYGHARRSWDSLAEFGMMAALFPATARAFDEDVPHFRQLLLNALENTDRRIASGKRVTPAFLIAVFLWPAYLEALRDMLAEDKPPSVARHAATAAVIGAQARHISIPRRFSGMVREIWELQDRLPWRNGKRAERVFEHTRFRAAYDFVLLRESAGEDLEGLGDWWTRYQDTDAAGRAELVEQLGAGARSPGRRKRRRRRRKPAS